MKTMEKKSYVKPEIKNTKIDYSITLTQSSQDPAPNNGPGVPTSPPDEIFINPLKWFK